MEQLTFSRFGTNDFAENPEPRVPCILLVDTSGSMSGSPIDQLNDGLRVYREEIQNDTLAQKRVEVCVVRFGGDVEMVIPFTPGYLFTPPVLEANADTPMGAAVSMAMETLEGRKNEYKSNGIAYYRPWIFLISDGEPTDDGWERVAAEAIRQQADKKFSLFAVGVEGANLQTLAKFSSREPLKLKGLSFRELFRWLSASQKSQSRSVVGEVIALPPPTWAEI